MRYFIIVTLLWLCYWTTDSFIWEIDDILPRGHALKIFEGAMFASNQGPPLFEKGPSYVELNAQLTSYSKTNNTNYFVILFYNIEEKYMKEEFTDVCSLDQTTVQSIPHLHNANFLIITTSYSGCKTIVDDQLNLNGDYCVEKAQVNYQYEVQTAGIQQFVVAHCGAFAGMRRTFTTLDNRQTATPTNMQSLPTTTSSIGSCTSKSLKKLHAVHQRFSPSLSTTSTATATVASSASSSPIIQTAANEYVTSEGVIEGTLIFHNPYGYIPGQLFGLLPFELVRMVICLFAFLLFLITYFRYLKSIMTLHTVLLTFLFLTAIESLFWYTTYQWLNNTGTPYCCPYPSLVIISLICSIFRQTCTRALLLLICLGYGIVRPKLMLLEWLLITTSITAYLLTTVLAEVYQIFMENSAPGGVWAEVLHTYEPYAELPMMITDMWLVAWMYLSIFSTIRILKEFRQSAKLSLYQQLVVAITILVLGFTVITILYWLDEQGILVWPWAWEWLQEALWQLLNFSIILIIAFIWRPHEHSERLAYASQIPTEDPDDDEEDEAASTRTATRYDGFIARWTMPWRSTATTTTTATAYSRDSKGKSRGGSGGSSGHGLLGTGYSDDDLSEDEDEEEMNEYEMVGYDRYHRNRPSSATNHTTPTPTTTTKTTASTGTARSPRTTNTSTTTNAMYLDSRQHGSSNNSSRYSSRRRDEKTQYLQVGVVVEGEGAGEEENYLDLPEVYEDIRHAHQ